MPGFWEGKPFKEIAEAEGFTTSAAIVTVRNAIIKLQKYYIKRGWMEPPKEEKRYAQRQHHPSETEKGRARRSPEEIRQLENRQKILENKQRNEERKARTRRLIERGAILEGIFPLAPDLPGVEVKAFLIALSHLPGAAELAAKLPKSGTSRKSLVYKGALIHRCRCRAPARGCCVLRPRWGATLPKPLVRHTEQNTRKRLFCSMRPEYLSPKGGATHRFLPYPRQYHQAQRGRFRCCRSRLPKRNQTDEWMGRPDP